MSETITVVGNIATDPEQRTIAEGVTVTSFRLASTHRRFDRANSEWVDAFTNYFTVSAFRALGTHAHASLGRGDRVVVTGRLRLREWDNGTRRGTTAEIDADALGPDLLWGTTVFTSATGGGRHRGGEQADRAETAASPSPARALTDDDGWAIPAAAADVDAPF